LRKNIVANDTSLFMSMMSHACTGLLCSSPK